MYRYYVEGQSGKLYMGANGRFGCYQQEAATFATPSTCYLNEELTCSFIVSYKRTDVSNKDYIYYYVGSLIVESLRKQDAHKFTTRAAAADLIPQMLITSKHRHSFSVEKVND